MRSGDFNLKFQKSILLTRPPSLCSLLHTFKTNYQVLNRQPFSPIIHSGE